MSAKEKADERRVRRLAQREWAQQFLWSRYSNPEMMRLDDAPSREDINTLASWLHSDTPKGE